ncbi:transcription antitermination factor NusG [Xanthobacter flavus]|uniref:Transcription antitermination factor NusG n=1 Tax=Xanthobacter flavus TaxID=281 RepID=A0A9W6CP22_XANFL|nr:transcription termination/antitermination NusG family protein [Xanthobacter flavus]MDR6334507.1 transcription antitermination factor NusG [Xanthobacter flavus]GLI23472.1 hypothetical protein XFLAVUS301_31460 [Xanthobacter flavus]
MDKTTEAPKTAPTIYRARPRERGTIVRCPTKPVRAELLLEFAGDLEWYVIRVAPQKEFVVQELLSRKGIVTYCPSDSRWRRKTRFQKAKQLIPYPLMPSYVFAGFVPGVPAWLDLFSIGPVLGCVGVHGEPRRVRPEGMKKLIGSYRNGLVRPDEEQFMKTWREYKRGDLVRISQGPFEGIVVPVVEVKGPNAKILLQMFGSEREEAIETWKLEPAA